MTPEEFFRNVVARELFASKATSWRRRVLKVGGQSQRKKKGLATETLMIVPITIEIHDDQVHTALELGAHANQRFRDSGPNLDVNWNIGVDKIL